MQNFKIKIFKWLLPKLLDKKCDNAIPRSGEEGECVNCYSVSFEDKKKPYFLLKGYKNNKLKGFQWSGVEYNVNLELDLESALKKDLRIRHYYGLSTIEYNSIYDFLFNYITKYTYLKIHILRILEKYLQFSFNKKKLISKQRIELLRFMMEDQIDRTHKGIGVIDLMTKLYSIRWVMHPSRDHTEQKLELYLDSLIDSGELEKINLEYVVQGKALSTIERYEEEERRHREAVILQKKMVSLTIILAFLALIQSGVVKLPTLIDFSQKTENVQSTHNKPIHATASGGA